MSRPPLPARLLVPALAAVLGSASLAQPAPTSGAASTAAARPILDWDLPAGALDDTLARIARQSGKLISADPALVRGKTAAAVRGPLSAQDAAQSAVRGSGLVLMQIGNDTWTVRPADTGAQAPAAPPTAAHSALPTVTIEGSRDPNQFYPAYTGGQVAKGARLGALGNTALLDAPFAISSYTEQAVRDAQARRLSDVLAIDPAVRSTNSESNSIDVFFLRGLPMLSQDISFNETFAVVDARRIAPEQLERIEVLKGPSALLNGIGPNSTTTGGTINLVPKRGTDVPLTRLTLLGSSHGQAGAHIDLGRRFGTDNRWGLRVNAMKREGDTGVQNEKTGTGHVSAALDYAGEKLRVSLDLAHNRRDFDGFAQLYRFNEGFRIPAPPSTGHTFAQPWDHSEGTSSSAVARVEYDLTPDSTVFGVLGGVTYRESNFTASSNRIVSASGNFTSMPTVFESDSTMRSGELGWRVRLDTGAVKHRVVLGYSRFAGDGDLLIRTFGSTLRSNLYNPVFTVAPTAPAGLRMQPSQDSSSDSVALMDSMHLLDDRLHLIAGLRYQRLNIGEFSGGRLVRRYDQQATAPSLAASYRLTPMLSVYGNYAEGLSQGPTAGGTTANAGAIFPPFKGKQLEAGLKYDAGPFGASAALFQIRQPVSYVNSSNYLVMDGEQSNRGLELSMYGQLSKQFRLNAGLALFDAVQSATLNGANDGKRAIGIPRYQLVLQGEWDVTQVPGLTLTGRFSKVARQMANADNTQSIPGFSQYDLGLRYATRIATRPTVLRLSLENAGNSSHWLGVRAGFLSRSTPRTLMLSVSTDF